MPQMAEETRLPVDMDAQPLVQAAAALRPVIRSYHEEIERGQRLPKALVEQLHAAGFYRLVIPRGLGGLQADPLTYLRVVELLSEGAAEVLSRYPSRTPTKPAVPTSVGVSTAA